MTDEATKPDEPDDRLKKSMDAALGLAIERRDYRAIASIASSQARMDRSRDRIPWLSDDERARRKAERDRMAKLRMAIKDKRFPTDAQLRALMVAECEDVLLNGHSKRARENAVKYLIRIEEVNQTDDLNAEKMRRIDEGKATEAIEHRVDMRSMTEKLMADPRAREMSEELIARTAGHGIPEPIAARMNGHSPKQRKRRRGKW